MQARHHQSCALQVALLTQPATASVPPALRTRMRQSQALQAAIHVPLEQPVHWAAASLCQLPVAPARSYTILTTTRTHPRVSIAPWASFALGGPHSQSNVARAPLLPPQGTQGVIGARLARGRIFWGRRHASLVRLATFVLREQPRLFHAGGARTATAANSPHPSSV